jgi:ABC-type uncharacterized transport system ATPase subunit
MKKIGMAWLVLIIPTILAAAEIKGTISKVNQAKNQLVLKTDRGEEMLETTKATKGVEHAKEGAKVVVTFSEKDGQPKVSEIAPGN